MAVELTERVQVLVEVVEPDGTRFRDAIYMTSTERTSKTEEELRAMGEARYAAWKAVVNVPSREPTRTEKRDALEALLYERKRIEAELDAADPADLAAVRQRPGVPQEPVARER